MMYDDFEGLGNLGEIDEVLEDLAAVRPTPKVRAAAMRFGVKAARKAPGQFKSFIQSTAKGSAVPLLQRSGLLYAARGIEVETDGGTGAQFSTGVLSMYARQQNETDPVLGELTGRYTNVQASGQLEAGRAFTARRMGFAVLPVDVPATASAEVIAAIAKRILESASAQFLLGSQVQIDWGPLFFYPGPHVQAGGVFNPAVDVNATGEIGSGTASVGIVGSWDRAFPLDPPIRIKGKQAFNVKLTLPQAALPASAIGATFAIYHAFHGVDSVAVGAMSA